MKRGALFAFTSSVAIAGCSSSETPMPAYGLPPVDAAADADAGGVGPVYGAPADTGGMVDDTGGAVPLYGAAPDK
jgi:hypothetical protein